MLSRFVIIFLPRSKRLLISWLQSTSPEIPAHASSSPVFLMMHSAYKLNKQGNNVQPWLTLFLFGTYTLPYVKLDSQWKFAVWHRELKSGALWWYKWEGNPKKEGIYVYAYLIHFGFWSHHFMGNRWGNSGNSVRLYFFWSPKSLQMVTAAMKLKDAYSLEEKLWPTSITY